MASISYSTILSTLTLLAGCCGEITTQSVPYPHLVLNDNPPVSRAGSDVFIMLPADQVMLDGRGSFDDHGITTYEWNQITGEPLTLQGQHESVLYLRDLKPSDSRFSLTVTDTKDHTDTSYVNVKIIPRECPDPFIVSGVQSPLHNGTYISGDTAQFVCQEGYRAHHTKSSIIHIQCSAEGLWVNILDRTTPIPTCERSLSCPMPDIPHGYLMERDEGYVFGDQGPVQCESGDRPENAFLVCQHDGTWIREDGSHQLPECPSVSETCEQPDDLENGKFQILDGAQLITGRVKNWGTVLYFCNSGYRLENEHENVARCRDGEWISELSRCIRTPVETSAPAQSPTLTMERDMRLCDTPPPVVAHARSSIYHTRGPGDEGKAGGALIAIYFCENGFRIAGDATTMRCETGETEGRTGGGTWHGTLPRCKSFAACPAPPDIDNGQYSFYTARHPYPDSPEDSHELGLIEEGTQVYYFCHNGYKMKDSNVSLMECKGGQWEGRVSMCEKRTHCDRPMDIPNGNWMFHYQPYPDYRIGSQLIYECDDNYKAIGSTHIKCLASGYWSDYAPKCLPKDEYCSEPGKIENGFHMCKPSTCELYKVGTEVDYICSKDHEPRPNDVMAQTCLPGGRWSAAKPVCATVLHSEPLDEVSEERGMASSTLTVVTATTCSVLGLLMLVIALIVLQRHRLHRPSTPLQPPPPPPYQVDAELPRNLVPAGDQHDRVALIQFADGVQIALPSYEEAIRPPPPQHLSHHHGSGSGGGRLSSHRGASIRSGDYRPLPSIPPCLRQAANSESGRQGTGSERDHHRNSIITTASSNTRDNLSLAFGSMDTVNVSDGTSTSITIGTYDSSNPSLAMSQRATAGSLASADSNNSLANEDAPLLERSSSTEPPLHPPHHDTSVNTPIDEEPDKE